MLVSTYPCRLQNVLSSGKRAISVGFSSDTISQRTPLGCRPARRGKSIDASVCPFLSSTPPVLALKGNMCPGLEKSSAVVPGVAKSLIVLALSAALIPVVIPA